MTNTKRYDINYTKFVAERIPHEISPSPTPEWMMAMVSPMVLIYNLLKTFRDRVLYRLAITPQVCYLEKMLNDYYDTSSRRIYIEDGSEYSKLYVFLKAELKPDFVFTKAEDKPKKFLYRRGEVKDGGIDFVVYVPSDIVFDNSEIRSRIDAYRLASKNNYSIQIF